MRYGVCRQGWGCTVGCVRIEYERRFIVKSGWRPEGPGKSLRQGWLGMNEVCETRVRLQTDKATATCKIRLADLAKRIEMETDIDPETAEALLLRCEHTLHKTRYGVRVGEALWEVDVYFGDLAGLCTAEIENPPDVLPLPEWIDREITGERGWSNAELARFGIPQE